MTNTPFLQGSQAFMDEAPTSSCSFAHGSTMHREWVEGWSHRQVRERAHRSRAIAELNVDDLFGDPMPAALAKLFRPIAEMD